MYGMFGPCVIIDSLDELIGEGLISKEHHKMYDKNTFKYILNHQELNKRVKYLPERDPREKQPQVSWERPLVVASTNRCVPSTSRRNYHLLIDDDPSTSRRNIE